MKPKLLYQISYYLGIISVIVGILAKLFGFRIFALAPITYLKFSVICVLYSIATVLSVKAFPEK
jgi:uncharacterized membrane protein YkgB